jgi:iron complex transport system substrate-binding protein
VLALLALITLAACGSNDADSGAPPDANAGGDGTEQPERIVSLSSTATEVLFAIGAGDQVVAVDDQSNYPADAPTTELSGFTPNLEAIAGYEPDLVVISNDTGDLVSGLGQLDIEVLLQPAPTDVDGIYDQISELGMATGNEDEASELVAEMKAEIDQLTAELPDHVAGMTYFHELDNTFFSVTSNTFIGSVYGLMGLENIADEAEDTAGGYPQLSAEFIVDASPDLIFLADAAYGESAETVAGRPGWDAITAVENGAVIEVDADLASRWGPRIVEFIREVSKRLGELKEGVD